MKHGGRLCGFFTFDSALGYIFGTAKRLLLRLLPVQQLPSLAPGHHTHASAAVERLLRHV